MRSSRPGIQTGQSYDLARRLERTRLALQLGSTQPKRWKVGSYIGAESPCSWADHSSAGRAIPAGLVVIVERMLDRARSLSSSSSGAARQGLLPRMTNLTTLPSVAGSRQALGTAGTKRMTKASALLATSRQPLSITSECPRPGISAISVTFSLCCCWW